MIITEVNRLFEIKITAIMLVVRGIVQVLDLNVVSEVISGIAGIGHIILGVSLILILLDIKIDRDKSTFKSHRDFDSEIEMTFKHF